MGLGLERDLLAAEVYDGEVLLNFTKTRRLLEVFKKLALGHSAPDASAHEQWSKVTKNGTRMESVQHLLGKAVQAITGKAEERGVESLFERGGTAISKDSYKGLDDFEVVAYMVVLEGVE